VTEELLPIADYFGNSEGYNENKMNVSVETEKGRVLDVPILVKSPWVYELEVERSIALDGGEVFFCRVRNVLVDEFISSNLFQMGWDFGRLLGRADEEYPVYSTTRSMISTPLPHSSTL
jgi:flavin reductase (DIM6/NTAB) family NADH-FMN oxidoreductase RutF